MPANKSVKDRFWEKVDKTDSCWNWTASIGSHGYGQLNCDGAPITAHRLSWELHNGPIPEHKSYHGMCVMHKCNNKICVNPGHLKLGTNAENFADAWADGLCSPPPRNDNQGEKSGNAKLTEKQATLIQHMTRYGGMPSRLAAKMFNVSNATIDFIRTGDRWGHI